MRRALWIVIYYAAMLLSLTGCDDDYTYPSLITEFADIYTNNDTTLTFIENDEGDTYVTRTPLQGLDPRYFYRAVCGYEITDDKLDTLPIVILYTLESVKLLHEDTLSMPTDPTNVTSVWRAGNYINLQLTPKTQGGTQTWNYRTDSIITDNKNHQARHHITLVHDQNDDPLSYSTTVYASLYLPTSEINPNDSIILTIQTFDEPQTWRFLY